MKEALLWSWGRVFMNDQCQCLSLGQCALGRRPWTPFLLVPSGGLGSRRASVMGS